jgi:hypothetical protein
VVGKPVLVLRTNITEQAFCVKRLIVPDRQFSARFLTMGLMRLEEVWEAIRKAFFFSLQPPGLGL